MTIDSESEQNKSCQLYYIVINSLRRRAMIIYHQAAMRSTAGVDRPKNSNKRGIHLIMNNFVLVNNHIEIFVMNDKYDLPPK